MKKPARKPHGRKTTSDTTVLIVFLVLLLSIIFFFDSSGTSDISVKDDQQKLLNLLVISDEQEDGPAIIVGNTVDSRRVSKLASTDYSKLKGLAGITSEFVIYFEDEQGNVINIADKPCIGSSYAKVNGINCNH